MAMACWKRIASVTKRGRNTKPPIGFDVPHALPLAGMRGVAGVTKAEKARYCLVPKGPALLVS